MKQNIKHSMHNMREYQENLMMIFHKQRNCRIFLFNHFENDLERAETLEFLERMN